MQRQLAELLHLSDDQTLPIPGSVQRMARGALYFRERRRTILGTDNFADPGWDLLLLLAANEGPTPGIACAEAARRSNTSAKVMERFAALLAKQGLVEVIEAPGGKHALLTHQGAETLARLIGAEA